MLLAVYGTLRKGEGNYDRYMRGTPTLGEQRIGGFEMYNLGGYYPYIARGGAIDHALRSLDSDFKRYVK